MKRKKDLRTYLPSLGIIIFIGFYFYAASLYPGGTRWDTQSVGFSWADNHWCNLMSDYAMNGQINPAKPVARAGMVILCSSMALFFFYFSKYFVKSSFWNKTIKIAGSIAMLAAVFIFTPLHDVMTTILSIGGTLVIIGIIRTLHVRKMTTFKFIGIACMLVVGMNNFFYYDDYLTVYSPLVQKMGFIMILGWTVGLNIIMNRKESSIN